jgi:transposase
VGLLRRRSRPDPETAQSTHLVQTRDHPGGDRFGQRLGPGLDRGPGLLPARTPRLTAPVDLPTRTHRGRKGERRSFSERDYADLLDAAHQQLGGPIMLVWDNLNTHISRAMREFIDARDWLRVCRLPAYAPELNGAEGVWANLKNGLGNHHFHGLDTLKAAIMTRLRRLQHRPDLITGLLAHTGLPTEPA